MQNYKKAYSNEGEIWFEVKTAKVIKFLQWAKASGCVWLNGKGIDANEKTTSLHYAITAKGLSGKIPLFA